MTNWQRHWNEFPAQVDDTDFLTQVGHTIGGSPYSDDIFQQMVGSISRALDLAPRDRLLDLCCGNGVITAQLARRCASVVGVDFSRPLLDVANRVHRPQNVRYELMDVTALADRDWCLPQPFSKILMYGSLQHLDRSQLPRLLRSILQISDRSPRILLGGVPNRNQRKQFLDSAEKTTRYFWRRCLGRDRIGCWWRPEELQMVCEDFGFKCTVDSQSQGRPGGHYRFDAILTKEEG